ncbi:MAG TPA: hypothetical protein VF277_09190 [Steroidobacteraceae bacterium]
MSPNALRTVVSALVLAALAGCAVDDGYQLPPLSQGGGGSYVPYAPYGPGYYGYGRGPFPYYGSPGYYDPRYSGYGSYSLFGYQGGYAPYGGYYSPYPRYVVVPCVDDNRDGRCDKRGRNHGSHQDGGNGDGKHHQNADNDARPRETAPRPAPTRPQTPMQPKSVDRTSPDRAPRDRQDPRNDKGQPQR